jgi:signal transduction histidine kinase
MAVMVNIFIVRQKAESDIKDAIIKTQENEQDRIAEDLHDDIGPMLSAIKLKISALSDANADEIRDSIGSIENYLNQAINDLRAVARNLSSQLIVKFGLEQSLNDNISMVSASKNINIRFNCHLKGFTLNPLQEINFYRIIRELLNNSVKHSNCGNIDISIEAENNNLVLLYKDDGESSVKKTPSKSMGQINIRNRVNLLGGEIRKFTDEFQKGASYEFVFPVKATI